MRLAAHERVKLHNIGMHSQSRYPRRRSPARQVKRSLPYRRRGPLLSRGEVAFYRVLRKAVGSQYHVAFKARLADLVTCSERAWDEGFGHMIARHHVDFVLCDFRTTEVVAAIELDDRSHAKPNRRRRDEFLDNSLSAAGIPLIRFPASAWYNAPSIADTISRSVDHFARRLR